MSAVEEKARPAARGRGRVTNGAMSQSHLTSRGRAHTDRPGMRATQISATFSWSRVALQTNICSKQASELLRQDILNSRCANMHVILNICHFQFPSFTAILIIQEEKEEVGKVWHHTELTVLG